jgi:hypothetical protein
MLYVHIPLCRDQFEQQDSLGTASGRTVFIEAVCLGAGVARGARHCVDRTGQSVIIGFRAINS